MEAASKIRQENARVGLGWEKLSLEDKEKIQRPLTSKEIQFLFTEVSPRHYTADMTVARLAYSHSGASRRTMTDALMKGEIKPGEEAQRLVESLEGRLGRWHLKDSISATKHFLESIRTPNSELKYKNSFDHKEIYGKLPPAEKDFVYQRAVQQKEQLETRFVPQLEQPERADPVEAGRSATTQIEKLEKAALLRDGIKSDLFDLLRHDPGLTGSELSDHVNQILARRFAETDSITVTKDQSFTSDLSRDIGRRIESGLRTARPADRPAEFIRIYPDNSSDDARQVKLTAKQRQPVKENSAEHSCAR